MALYPGSSGLVLNCPAGGFDLGVGGISHVEMLIL